MAWWWEDITRHARQSWLYIIALFVLLFLLLPVLIVIPMSFSASQYLEFPPSKLSLRWYREFFGSSEWLDSALVSLQVATLTTVVTVPLGAAAAYGFHCAFHKRWVRVFQGAILAPMIIPGIVVSIGVFYLYARLGLVNTIAGLILAHTALALPFVVLLVAASLRQFDMNQEMAARSLGASRGKAFIDITMPQISRALLSGALLAFVTSLDEVVVALFVSSGANSTLTRRMFASLRDQIDPTIAAISTLLILGTLLVVALSGIRPVGVWEKPVEKSASES